VPEILPYAVTALLYGALAFYSWRIRSSPAAAAPSPAGSSGSIEHYAVLVPLGLHTALLARAMFAGDGLQIVGPGVEKPGFSEIAASDAGGLRLALARSLPHG